jgi:putative NIF3 family GTP cyclohydrolase 1 type 2
MIAREIARIFKEIAPLDSGIPGDELGFIWGNPDAPVRGVGCLWCVHTESIKCCAKHNLNLIICHETLWLPGQDSPWYDGPDKVSIYSNQERRKLLEEYSITVYRSHSNWDALPNDGISDSAVAALQMDSLQEVARQKFFSVQELPASVSVQDLRKMVEAGLDYADCRIFGNANKPIRRFAFLIGGFGENQLHMPQAAKAMGADAIIIGEMSEFIVISCLEMGLPVIETLHSASEIPGIKRQTKILAERLPDIPVRYVPSGALSFQP